MTNTNNNILKKIDAIKSVIDSYRPFYLIDLTQNKRTEVYWSACELVNNHFKKIRDV